jgi:hypothetical protein
LLKKFAHSRNLLTEFACSIEKLLTMKNLAGSDGSTRLLNVSYQANRSTAGAHHSTVSVVTAGTCWAGPSCGILARKVMTNPRAMVRCTNLVLVIWLVASRFKSHSAQSLRSPVAGQHRLAWHCAKHTVYQYTVYHSLNTLLSYSPPRQQWDTKSMTPSAYNVRCAHVISHSVIHVRSH